jgi:hypothetical protein
MKLARIAAAAAVGALFCFPVRAELFPDGGVTPAEVADMLLHKGFTAEIGTTGHADRTPIISSAAAGAKFAIYFYNCDKTGECKSIQFFAGYHHRGVSVEAINKWNEENRFGRAYLSRSARFPNIEMDVLADRGFTSESLEDYLDMWTLLMGHFQGYIGW